MIRSRRTRPAGHRSYVQALVTGGLVFCPGRSRSTQAPGSSCRRRVGADRRVLANSRPCSSAAQPLEGREDHVYLADMGDFAAMNAAYENVFARTAGAVDGAGARLPRDADRDRRDRVLE